MDISLKSPYTFVMASAIVLLSGGQDSATCLAIAQTEVEKIHCVSFNYGQRHVIELESAKKLATLAGATLQEVDVRFLGELSNSSLVSATKPIIAQPGRLPSTFVPGRNALFLTIAAMIAYEKKAEVIYTGVCQTDYSGYPDCREAFISSQESTLNLAMEGKLSIKTPLMHLTKADTVIKMKELDRMAWYGSTHTCYEGKQPACGRCPACRLRLKGFKEAGERDPLPYQT